MGNGEGHAPGFTRYFTHDLRVTGPGKLLMGDNLVSLNGHLVAVLRLQHDPNI